MISLPKATLVIAGTCAALLCGVAACKKAPSQGDAGPQAAATAGSSSLAAGLQEPPLAPPGRTDPASVATRQKYFEWVEEKAIPAGLQRPSLPDPNRTDPAAIMARYKYALWDAAQTKVDGDRFLKQEEHILGTDKPAPKGNYGRMADGLPQLGEHK